MEGTSFPATLLEKDIVVKIFKADFDAGRGNRSARAQILDELVLSCNKHHSLLPCLGFTQSPPFWALFEECNRGSLRDALRGALAPDGRTRIIDVVRDQGIPLVVEFADGMAHLHAKGVLHCDLHGGNVLLHEVDGRLSIRITDFGLSCRMLDQRCAPGVALRERDRFRKRFPQVAPESVAGYLYTKATDMWSVGYIVQQILGLERVNSTPLEGLCRVQLSEPARYIVNRCGLYSAKDRPSAKELLDVFRLEL